LGGGKTQKTFREINLRAWEGLGGDTPLRGQEEEPGGTTTAYEKREGGARNPYGSQRVIGKSA